MTAALYLTIWISLVLFAVGETGRHMARRHAWPWPAFAAGLLLCVVHILIALAHTHGWSHSAAMAATAAQTRAIYGLDWGGGIFVNYAFVAAWAMDAWIWRGSLRQHRRRPSALRWLLRIFYGIVVLNAAVIFATGFRRALGLAIVIWLVWLWLRQKEEL